MLRTPPCPACENCDFERECNALSKLEELRELWKERPDEYIVCDTPSGGYGYTPNSLYDEWVEKFESLLSDEPEEDKQDDMLGV